MVDGLELQNVSGKPLSKYGNRYSEWSRENNWIRERTEDTNWLLRKRFDSKIRLTMTHGTIEEVEYGGHQILIVGYHWKYQYFLNSNGERSGVTTDFLESTINETSTYYATSYRIDEEELQLPPLQWNSQRSLFSMVYVSNSANNTLKKAMKRIDLENKLLAVRDELIDIANDRWNNGFTNYNDNQFAPYNARINDKVFIQAHGRLRRGIIVDTTGSRFVVGYLTPSNFKDMKFKTLPLSLMYVAP